MSLRINSRAVGLGSIGGLAVGFGAGVATHVWQSSTLLGLASLLEPVGTIWVNALRMIVLPLVVSQLFVAVASVSDTRKMGRVGGLSLLGFLVLLALAGAFTVSVGPLLVDRVSIDPATQEAFRVSAGEAMGEAVAAPGERVPFAERIVQLVPANPLGAAAAGEILPVVVATLLFALAAARIAPASRRYLLGFFQAVNDTTYVLLSWILAVLPLGVFTIAFSVSARTGFDAVGAVGIFTVLLSALLLAVTLALYPMVALVGRVSPRRFAWGVAPSQAVALGTRSSLASLPVLMEGAEQRLRLPSAVSALTLPLAVSVFKVNRTISSPLKLIFLTHLYGIPLETGYLIVLALMVMLLSFSSPGIPGGGSMVTYPLYMAAGIPIQGLLLFEAADVLSDYGKTLANVTADMAVAVFVARFVGVPGPTAPAVPRPLPDAPGVPAPVA